MEGGSYNDAREAIGDGGIMPLYKLLRRSVEAKIQEGIEAGSIISDTAVMVSSLGMLPIDVRAVGMPPEFLTLRAALIDSSRAVRKNAEIAVAYITNRMSVLTTFDKLMDRYENWWGVWRGIRGHGRLVIPVENGWWTSRSLLNLRQSKYISCARPKGNILYNFKALETYKRVAIAEGVFSAEFIGDHAIALCGKTATPEQLARLINSNVREFEVCLDSGTERETEKLAQALHRGGKSVDVRIYSAGDPASTTQYTLLPYSMTTSLKIRWEMV